jgi:prevent-host-death family protein
METITIHKAKTELSKLIERVESGEDIVIARGNKPVARLTALNKLPKSPKRSPGSLKHLRGDIPDQAFFAPLSEDELKLWEGGD